MTPKKICGFAVIVLACGGFISGCASGGKTGVQVEPELAPLGKPRRNVAGTFRTAEKMVQPVLTSKLTGVIPVMQFKSNALIVENVYQAAASLDICQTAWASYNKRLIAEHGANKIRHRLLCVVVKDGRITQTLAIADSL